MGAPEGKGFRGGRKLFQDEGGWGRGVGVDRDWRSSTGSYASFQAAKPDMKVLHLRWHNSQHRLVYPLCRACALLGGKGTNVPTLQGSLWRSLDTAVAILVLLHLVAPLGIGLGC